jgi:hypothetical protein
MEPRWALIRKIPVPQLPLAQLTAGLCVAGATLQGSFNFIPSLLIGVF